VNFIRLLALQEKKLDDSSHFDVEIARVREMLPILFPFWSLLICTPRTTRLLENLNIISEYRYNVVQYRSLPD